LTCVVSKRGRAVEVLVLAQGPISAAYFSYEEPLWAVGG
jgi:hypothetical protein